MIEQFTLRKGDIVNPFMRPAGVLIPTDAGREGWSAGFNQIEAQVMRAGMVAEVTCVSKPLTIIPMVVTEVQDLIAAGQVRASDQLIDAQQVAKPGTITVFLEPLYRGWSRRRAAGQQLHRQRLHQQSRLLDDPGISTPQWLFLHVIDTVGVVHALILGSRRCCFRFRRSCCRGIEEGRRNANFGSCRKSLERLREGIEHDLIRG